MQALKPMLYLMMGFFLIVFLYYGVPAGVVSGIVVGDSARVNTRVNNRRGGKTRFTRYKTSVSIDDGRVVSVESKIAMFEKDSAELKRYFSILKWDYWYSFR